MTPDLQYGKTLNWDRFRAQRSGRRNASTGAAMARPAPAFTLLEMLVGMAIIAILAALLLPALAKGASRAKSVYCLGNLKQIQAAWLSYAFDNSDSLPPNTARNLNGIRQEMPGSWVCGSALADTNTAMIEAGVLFKYLSQGVFRCPSDRSFVINHPNLLRTRSYSMCFWMNGDTDPTPSDPAWENGADYPEVKHKLAGVAAHLFVFIDENEQSIDDGLMLVGNWFPPQYRWVPDVWYGLPSDRHDQGCSLSFADGHVEHWRWNYPKTFQGPGQHVAYASQDPGQNDLKDLRRLQARLPFTP